MAHQMAMEQEARSKEHSVARPQNVSEPWKTSLRKKVRENWEKFSMTSATMAVYISHKLLF
jgi:hypothetical protein